MLISDLWIKGQIISYVERCAARDDRDQVLDWYVLRSAPNAEFRARDDLQRHGFIPYVPTELRWVPQRRGDATKVSRPLFYGYVFLGHAGPPDWLKLKRVGSIAGAACIGLAPIKIPSQDMLDVMSCEAIGGFDLTFDGVRDKGNRAIEKGTAVEVDLGPFEGLKGFVVRMPKAQDKPVVIKGELRGHIVTIYETVDRLSVVA